MNWMPDEIEQSLIDFSVNGIRLGTVRPDMAKLWCSIQLTTDGEMGGNNGDMDATTGSTATSNNDSAAFCMACDDTDGWYMTLNANVCGTTFESRSAAVAQITEQLRHRNIVTGWRNELYPIAQSFYEQPVFCMERAAVPFLGALEYGVHINGLVHGNQVEQQQQQLSEADTAPVRMWMARRSATKSKFPGMLDHIAAGGQPMGLSLTDNVVKECWEEAGIPASITTTSALQPAGAVSYRRYAAHKDVVVRMFHCNCFVVESTSQFHSSPVTVFLTT